MSIEIINGEVYEKLPENHLAEEIARRTDEIVRVQALLVTLQGELDAMTVKKVELVAQREVLKPVKEVITPVK